MRYRKPPDTRDLLHSCHKHCFTCVLMAQWGMGWGLEAIIPEMKTQIQKQTETLSYIRGTLEENRGTVGPKKYPKFHENTDLVRKFNSETDYYTTKTLLR